MLSRRGDHGQATYCVEKWKTSALTPHSRAHTEAFVILEKVLPHKQIAMARGDQLCGYFLEALRCGNVIGSYQPRSYKQPLDLRVGASSCVRLRCRHEYTPPSWRALRGGSDRPLSLPFCNNHGWCLNSRWRKKWYFTIVLLFASSWRIIWQLRRTHLS